MTPVPAPPSVGTGAGRQVCHQESVEKFFRALVLPQLWVLGRESSRNTSENPIKRTILFFAKGNSWHPFVAG